MMGEIDSNNKETEAIAKSEESMVKSEESMVKSEESMVKSEESMVKTEEFIVKTETSSPLPQPQQSLPQPQPLPPQLSEQPQHQVSSPPPQQQPQPSSLSQSQPQLQPQPQHESLSLPQPTQQPPRPRPPRRDRHSDVVDEAALTRALEQRIYYAEKFLREMQPSQRPTQILYAVDLFAGDDLKLMRQVSLRATKCVQAYCHVMFDLSLLLGAKGKDVKDVARVRFKHTYDSTKQKYCIQEAVTARLAAVWQLAPMPLDLDQDLTTFGCWNIHRGPINKIFACLTGVLRNRVRNQQALLHAYQLCQPPIGVNFNGIKREFERISHDGHEGKEEDNDEGKGEQGLVLQPKKRVTPEEDAALAILSLSTDQLPGALPNAATCSSPEQTHIESRIVAAVQQSQSPHNLNNLQYHQLQFEKAQLQQQFQQRQQQQELQRQHYHYQYLQYQRQQQQQQQYQQSLQRHHQQQQQHHQQQHKMAFNPLLLPSIPPTYPSHAPNVHTFPVDTISPPPHPPHHPHMRIGVMSSNDNSNSHDNSHGYIQNTSVDSFASSASPSLSSQQGQSFVMSTNTEIKVKPDSVSQYGCVGLTDASTTAAVATVTNVSTPVTATTTTVTDTTTADADTATGTTSFATPFPTTSTSPLITQNISNGPSSPIKINFEEELRFRENKYVEMRAKVEKYERFIARRQDLSDEWAAFNK